MPEKRRIRKKIDKPFPGLRPFEKRENLVFFGREGQVDELISRLKRNHFLAVLGASGSGKSSLVRAGLLPALEGGLMSDALAHWKIALMRPGDRPMTHLRTALAELVRVPAGPAALISPEQMLDTMLRSSSFGLIEAARGPILGPQENLLVVVDQFEEIFRFRNVREESARINEAAAFIKLLLEAGLQTDVPIYVVITMRSDFLGECPRFHGLAQAINKGQYLVPRLTRAQMREAIVGPIAVFKEKIAPDLVIHLLNDVGDNPDQLPILQHALMRTWDRHESGTEITVADYEAIGGMRQALNQHAEEIYRELESRNLHTAAEGLFRCITQKEADGKGIRRPTRLSEVCLAANASKEDIIAVVEAFRKPGRSFLMPPVGTPLDDDTVLDISHESFMRIWRRLVGWVEEEARSARQYQRLAQAAREHRAEKVNVWRQPELGIALKWKEDHEPTEGWAKRYDKEFALAMSFLAKSEAAWIESEKEKERVLLLEQETEESRRTVWKQRITIGILIALLCVSAYAIWWALSERQRADKEKHRAEVESERATGLAQLAESRADTLDSLVHSLQQYTGVLQDRNARIEDQKDQLSRRQAQLARERNKLADANRRLAVRGEKLTDALEVAEQRKAEADSSARESERNARVAEKGFNLLQAQELAVRALDAPDRKTAAKLALMAYKLNADNEGEPYDPDIYLAMQAALSQYENQVKRTFSFRPYAMQFTGDDSSAVLTDMLGGHYLYNNKTGLHMNLLGAGIGGTEAALISPDGETILVPGLDGAIWRYSRNDSIALRSHGRMNAHEAPVTALAYDAERKRLYSGDQQGNLYQWDLSASNWRASSKRLEGVEGAIHDLALAQGGTFIAIAHDGGIRMMPVMGMVSGLHFEHSTASRVTAVAFNSRTNTIAFGLKSGRVGFVKWNGERDFMGNGASNAVHSAAVTDVAFSPNGDFFASASYDQTIRVWRTDGKEEAPPVVLVGHTSWVTGLDFNASGNLLFSSSRDKSIRKWYVRIDELKDKLCGYVDDSKMSAEQIKQYQINDDEGLPCE